MPTPKESLWEKRCYNMKVIGLTGLGKTAISFALRLRKEGMTVVGYDPLDVNRKKADASGIVTTSSIQAVVLHLPQPKNVWLIPPVGKPTDAVVRQLADLLSPGDLFLDGSASYPQKKARRQAIFKNKNIRYLALDVKAALNGHPVEFFGDLEAFEQYKPLFEKIFVVNDER